MPAPARGRPARPTRAPTGRPAAWSIAPTRAGADGRARVEAERPDAARGWVEEPEHQPDGGALAGPVAAEQRDGLAGLDGEPAVVQREGAAEAAGCAVELDGVDGSVLLRCVRDHAPSIAPGVAGAKSPASLHRP